MKRTPLLAWTAYAGVGLLVTGLAAVIATSLASGAHGPAIWVAAGVAYALQLLGFALLLALRGQAQLFMMAWVGGMMLRFGALGLCAYWLSRTDALARGPTLLSLVGFLFLLLLLEPVFLRWDLRES